MGILTNMSWVLFFDGECALCCNSIRRLAKWDRHGLINYAPLQGNLAAEHDLQKYLDGDHPSMVLRNMDGGQVFTQSDCVFQILRLLGGAWRMLLAVQVLPRSISNRIYQLIAENRRRWSGNSGSACELPDERLRSRLLD